MGAYEVLWQREDTTFKKLSQMFASSPGATPSDFVSESEAMERGNFVKNRFEQGSIKRFGVRIHGAGEYPQKLRDAAHPIELLYYQGWWDLVESRSVAVVGTRHPTQEGLARTRKLVQNLVRDDFTVVSGLATGIDTKALTTAMQEGGHTIAVIGTPLSHFYPRENRALQEWIAKEFLVISQVPLCRYEQHDYRWNRAFFPERNITMSALTEATIIVEASDTSGTLIQARAALKQGRKLFILESCFHNKQITWPQRFAKQGAIRVSEYDEIRQHLANDADQN
jgi:DNA processing protein